MKKRRGSGPSKGPLVENAVRLGPRLNNYVLQSDPPKTIVLQRASRLVGVEQVTVSGRLLKNQIIHADPKTGRRRIVLGPERGKYIIREDGSLRFCLGVKQFQSHISCELTEGAALALLLNKTVGQKVTVSGFLHCLFDEPGFQPTEDAHLFQIHPVRAISLSGSLLSFDSAAPGRSAVQEWTSTLSERDDRIQVQYWKGTDTLVFSNVGGREQRYVRVSGGIRNLKLNLNRNRAAWFTFDSPQIGKPVRVSCLQGTNAASQLQNLQSDRVSMVALRHVDLNEALKDRYAIRLLAIDMQHANDHFVKSLPSDCQSETVQDAYNSPSSITYEFHPLAGTTYQELHDGRETT